MRSGIRHRKAEPGLAQHLHVVAAVAEGHHVAVLYPPALLQDPQAVGFMHAGDNQVDTAVTGGDGHHDVAEFFMQQRLNTRNFIIRHVKPELEENIVQVAEIADHFQTVIVFCRDGLKALVIALERVGAALPAGDNLNARHVV